MPAHVARNRSASDYFESPAIANRISCARPKAEVDFLLVEHRSSDVVRAGSVVLEQASSRHTIRSLINHGSNNEERHLLFNGVNWFLCPGQQRDQIIAFPSILFVHMFNVVVNLHFEKTSSAKSARAVAFQMCDSLKIKLQQTTHALGVLAHNQRLLADNTNEDGTRALNSHLGGNARCVFRSIRSFEILRRTATARQTIGKPTEERDTEDEVSEVVHRVNRCRMKTARSCSVNKFRISDNVVSTQRIELRN